MSYILDALRKADAQRERDPARGIHAQGTAVAPTEPAAPRARTWLWAGLAAGGVAATVAGWKLLSVPQPQPQAVPVAAAPVPAAPVPPPAPSAPPPPPPPPAQAPPAPATAVMPPPPEPLPAPPKQAAAPSTAKAVAPVPPPAAPVAERVATQSELPPEVQRELPKITLTGAVYSDNPSQRMLIVNGQVVGEGADLGQGLVLEQIRAKSAVLRFRGHRYAVGY